MSGPIRLLVGSDSAGFDYKDHILPDMQADDRVEVVDLGVFKEDLEGSSYPSVAITAGTKIAAGEADRAILVCVRPSRTTPSASSGQSCPTTARYSPSANV